MKITVPIPTEIEVDTIRVHAPVRYDEEREELAGHPGFDGRTLTLDLEIDTGRVRDWPAGRESQIHLKVVDEGSYELMWNGAIVAECSDCYVPSCVPGEWGDYVVMTIAGDGAITGPSGGPWQPTEEKILAAFFGGDE